MELWNSLPAPLQVAALAVLVALVAYALVSLLNRVRAHMGQDTAALLVLAQVLGGLIDLTYEQAREALDKLPVNAQREELVRIARGLYAALPATVTLNVNKRQIVVPLKFLLSEGTFIDLFVAAYGATGSLVEELRRALEEAYRQRKTTVESYGLGRTLLL